MHAGDVYYDLAKLNHNLTVNHDLVNRGFFDADPSNCYILTNSKLNECKEILHQFELMSYQFIFKNKLYYINVCVFDIRV